MLGHLLKISGQISSLVDANKGIKYKPKKSKHPNIQKCQERRSSRDIRDQYNNQKF